MKQNASTPASRLCRLRPERGTLRTNTSQPPKPLLRPIHGGLTTTPRSHHTELKHWAPANEEISALKAKAKQGNVSGDHIAAAEGLLLMCQGKPDEALKVLMAADTTNFIVMNRIAEPISNNEGVKELIFGVAMTNDNTFAIEASTPPSPRVIGWVWVIYFLIGILGTLLTKGIVVPTDAASTANNILTHANLYRAGFGVDLVANLIYIALTALVFQLFRPVNPTLALLAAFFSLVGCTVQIVGELLRVAPTVVLANPQLATAFGAQQLQAAALLSVTLYKSVFYISFVLFACFELVTGSLILRSTFLPRWLGWWWVAGGIGGLTFLWSPLATSIWPLLLVAGAGEFVLPVWLLVKGVDNSKWRAVHT